MKKLCLFILCVLLLFPAALPVLAFDETLPRIVDDADLLTDAEEAALLPRIDGFLSLGFDCVILTNRLMLGTQSVESYTDDYYDNRGYGADGIYYGSAPGTGRSGFLFYVNMAERQLYINTAEEGINVLDDYAVDRLLDEVTPYFSRGEYYEGFVTYLDRLYNRYLVAYCNPEPYNPDDPYDPYTPAYPYEPYEPYYPYEPYEPTPQSRLTPGAVAVCLAIGFGISGIVFGSMRHNMKNARVARNADYALRRDTFHVTTRDDRFLYSHTRRIPINTDSGSAGHGGSHGGGHSGGSFHTSAGGVSHGGGGRSF